MEEKSKEEKSIEAQEQELLQIVERIPSHEKILLREGVKKLAQIARKAAQEAAVDQLTGLASRRVFIDALERAHREARRDGTPVTVAMIDLDGFKAVNDKHGHITGDAVLRLAAERISRIIRGDALAARYGGDEFVLLLHVSPEQAGKICERICTALASPMKIGEKEITIGASIGLAPVLVNYKIEEILSMADKAMYEDKKRRNGGETSRS
ncbi:MAG: GGDEF domain-containing protein [Candidatus Wildermuthbacteria bacterium]|nr:GGDEF domain-containing protein [Candidatus Wildermuthbacteria bacterium]